jgi:hypothetical protein
LSAFVASLGCKQVLVEYQIPVELRELGGMAAQDILERAREGDPSVIAAVLNRVLRPLGVRSQAARRDRTLLIVCSGDTVPDEERMTTVVRKLVDELEMQSIEQIQLYGQQAGEESVAWKQSLTVIMEPQSETSMTHSNSDAPNMYSPEDTPPVPPADTPVEPLASTPAEPVVSDPFAMPASASVPPPAIAPTSPEPLSTAASTVEPEALAAAVTPENSDRGNATTDATPTPASVSSPATAAAPTPAPATATLQRESAAAIAAEVPPEAFSSGEETEVSRLLQRPEAVVLLFLLALATLWDLYLDLAEGEQRGAISGAQLAIRLDVSPSTISRRKRQDGFSTWSQTLDPDGIAWVYQNGRFLPLDDSVVASS